MFHEKLNDMRPYVTGIRFVKDLPVVDVVLLDGWDMFESDTVSYKLGSSNKNYFMVIIYLVEIGKYLIVNLSQYMILNMLHLIMELIGFQ